MNIWKKLKLLSFGRFFIQCNQEIDIATKCFFIDITTQNYINRLYNYEKPAFYEPDLRHVVKLVFSSEIVIDGCVMFISLLFCYSPASIVLIGETISNHSRAFVLPHFKQS